jgi:hypothetical protein
VLVWCYSQKKSLVGINECWSVVYRPVHGDESGLCNVSKAVLKDLYQAGMC